MANAFRSYCRTVFLCKGGAKLTELCVRRGYLIFLVAVSYECAVLDFVKKASSKVTAFARTIVAGWAFTMWPNNAPRMRSLEKTEKNKT